MGALAAMEYSERSHTAGPRTPNSTRNGDPGRIDGAQVTADAHEFDHRAHLDLGVGTDASLLEGGAVDRASLVADLAPRGVDGGSSGLRGSSSTCSGWL